MHRLKDFTAAAFDGRYRILATRLNDGQIQITARGAERDNKDVNILRVVDEDHATDESALVGVVSRALRERAKP